MLTMLNRLIQPATDKLRGKTDGEIQPDIRQSIPRPKAEAEPSHSEAAKSSEQHKEYQNRGAKQGNLGSDRSPATRR